MSLNNVVKNSFGSTGILLLLFFFGLNTIQGKNLSPMVNLFIGTSGDNGQVDPGATVPFGMVRVCPDSDPRTHAGYDFSVTNISGISINRLSGVGCSGAGGNLSIKPAPLDFKLYLLKKTERAIPGYYETTFSNEVKAELTATKNIALERYTFPKGMEALLTINFGSSFERLISENHTVNPSGEIEGQVVSANVCGRGRYSLFFNLKADRSFTIKLDAVGKMVLVFDPTNATPVEIRIAVSSVSQSAANKENKLAQTLSFNQVKAKAASLWEKKLSRIKVKGTKNDQTIFYTSLYRVYLSPADVTSSNGEYLGTDATVHDAKNFSYYSSWSLWDTYRTKFPLLALMEPTSMSDMSQSLVNLYQTGKQNWSTDAEATATVRTEHAVILLLDAYRKGIKNIDFRACYPKLCLEANELLLITPDQKLESACDLWALSEIATILNEKEDAAKYKRQAEQLFETTWKKEFMTIDPTYTHMRNN